MYYLVTKIVFPIEARLQNKATPADITSPFERNKRVIYVISKLHNLNQSASNCDII